MAFDVFKIYFLPEIELDLVFKCAAKKSSLILLKLTATLFPAIWTLPEKLAWEWESLTK